MKQTLHVDLGSRSYDIIIAPELVQNSKPYLDPIIAGRRVAIVSDKIVSNKYLNLLSPTLDSITDSWDLYLIEGGEDAKSFSSLEKLLDRMPTKGVDRQCVVIAFGGGVVGENAAIIATGMRAKVHIVDKSQERLKQLTQKFGDKIIPQLSDNTDLEKLISDCDLLVGGVLIPGAEAPKLITKDMLKNMKRGSVIVDVAIDQGGCVETSKPTTFAEPTYIVDDIVHYCVANMPGGVPRTSTIALNKATLPFLSKLAKEGYKKALMEDINFMAGLNVHKGQVTYKAVADSFGYEYSDASKVIN